MAIENVNLLKIQLVNQMRTFIKGMSVFFGSEVDTETDSELDIQSKVKMFLENPQLAEEMTLEDIVVLLEDFNDTLETAPFKDTIEGLKNDIVDIRKGMIDLVNRPVIVTNPVKEVVKETFNTEVFDSIKNQISKIAGELQGFATKESVVKLQLRVRKVEDALPGLEQSITDLRNELNTWKKNDKKDVTIYKGNGGQSMTLGVTSVFGRSGPVVAVAGDYNASQITYTPSSGLTSTDVQGALDELAARPDASGKEDIGVAATLDAAHVAAADPHTQYQKESEKGAINGYAELDGTGKVPAAQLPSYVDDILEYANLAAFPVTGSTGIIYVALDTNKIYRWSGATYIEVSPGVTYDDGGISFGLYRLSGLQVGDGFKAIIPFGGTITGWVVATKDGTSGTITLDVKKVNYAGVPTFTAIDGSEKILLSAAAKNQDLTLTTWTTAVTADDHIEITVNSVTGTVTGVYGIIKVTKSS